MARQSTVAPSRLTSGGHTNKAPTNTAEQPESSSEPDEESDEQGPNEEEDSLPTEITAWYPVADFQAEFDVILEDGSESQLTERQVQTLSSSLVYRWWVSHGGRDDATGFDEYHIFRILDHALRRDGKVIYEIQWVGYPVSQSS
ncbi:hypothetical protein ACHAP5_011394 [Fusarium lateritium]